MKKFAALIALSALALPMVTWADYFEDAAALEAKALKDNPPAPIVKKVDVSKYSLTELEIKKSLLRVLFARGWEVHKQSRHVITAQYKDTTIKISIDGAAVEFRETSAPHKSEYGWIAAAADNFRLESQYYYQVNQAEKMISSGAE